MLASAGTTTGPVSAAANGDFPRRSQPSAAGCVLRSEALTIAGSFLAAAARMSGEDSTPACSLARAVARSKSLFRSSGAHRTPGRVVRA
jgi:hypothetical protein